MSDTGRSPSIISMMDLPLLGAVKGLFAWDVFRSNWRNGAINSNWINEMNIAAVLALVSNDRDWWM